MTSSYPPHVQDRVTDMMRAARNMGYSVRYDPFRSEDVVVENARKPTELKQWLLEKNELEVSVVNQYSDLQPGIVRQLMSSTGAGKTTRVPLAIASRKKAVVVVLQPMMQCAFHVKSYVVNALSETYGLKGRVDVLSSRVARDPPAAPYVHYGTVGEFLALYSANPDLLQRAGIDCIIVDESHSERPEYIALKYLISAGKFQSVRILYCSATAATDVSMESNPNMVMKYDPDIMRCPPEALTPVAPNHHSNIRNRTLLFVGYDSEFADWEEYYDHNDIPVHVYGYCQGTRDIVKLERFLEENPVCVVVTTAILQTTFTLNIDTVIDLGYTARLVSDFAGSQILLDIKNATRSDQVQRAGRVNRIKPGMAHLADIENELALGANDPDVCAYVYLWARMFGLRVKSGPVAQFNEIFGTLDLRTIANLLVTAIPPLAALPYFADDGLYAGWASSFKMFRSAPGEYNETKHGDEANLETWPTLRLTDEDVPNDLREYCCRVPMPRSFGVLQACAWHSYSGSVDDAASVVMSVFSEAPKRLADRSLVKPPPAYVPYAEQRGSTMSALRVPLAPKHNRKNSTLSTVDEETASALHIPMSVKSNSGYTRAAKSSTKSSDTAKPETVFQPTVETKRVEKWVDETVRSSSTASDRSGIVLRKVRPSDYHMQVFYPWDEDLRHEYLKSSAVRKPDRGRVKRCLDGTVSYGSLSADTQTLRERQKEYFLSFLRVHEATVTDMLQSKASLDSERKKFGIFGSKNDSDHYVEKLKKTARLLDMCSSVGYAVGIERGHTSIIVSMSSGSSETQVFDRERGAAKVAICLGNKLLQNATVALKEAAAPIITGHGIETCFAGNGWFINGKAVTSAHILRDMHDKEIRRWCGENPPVPDGEDDVFCTVVDDETVDCVVRTPNNGEKAVLMSVTSASGTAHAYGFHTVNLYGEQSVIDGVYAPGFSGSLLVSTTDGAVIGIYMGSYHRTHGRAFGKFTPIAPHFN